ncbi:O-antigen ligase family protein [Eisenbergiella porci]|uniref:O-antigen ligase family protein n=1 Tax=Eisenbergiella porci TaxID=2652274 RepID=UPI002A7FFE61|nr:O-antigen ligase family protein [Eisenbergiella porci]
MKTVTRGRKKTVIRIEIFLLTLSFLMSIGTSFFESSIYYNAAVVLMVLSLGVHFVLNGTTGIKKRLFSIICIVLVVLIYNYILSPLATKKLFVYLSAFLMGVFLAEDGDEEGIRSLLCVYSCILTVSALYGVFETLFGNKLDVYTVRTYAAIYRLHSIYLHPIIFSLMMLQAFAINHFLIKNQTLKNILGMINVYCIFMSLSRSSWLVLAILIVLIILQKKKTQKKPLLLGKVINKQSITAVLVLAIIIGIFLQKADVLSYWGTLLNRWQALEGSMSVSYRSGVVTAVWQDRVQDLNPIHWILGSGYHSVQNAVGRAGIYFGTVGNNVVDNEWVTLTYDFGLLGIMILLYFTWKSLYIFFSKNESENMWIVALCIIVNLMMALICDTFGWAPAGNIAFVFFGVMFYKKRIKLKDSEVRI